MIFTAENTLLIGSILLFVSIVVGKTGYRFGVPTLLLFLVVGMLFGSDGLGLQFHDAKDAQFIGMVALSIILFSGGMDTKFREIKPILGPGIVLSTVGVLLTALFTGLFIWWISGMSWSNIYLPITTSLLLASTMSSTDSASVFAILRSQKMNLKHNLRPMLELESGSNDPMAYMLTIVLIQFIQSSGMGVGAIVGSFVIQFIVGAAAGYVLGKLAIRMLNKLNIDNQALYPILLLAFVFFTFSITDLLKGNGYLAVYIAGIMVGNNKIMHRIHLYGRTDLVVANHHVPLPGIACQPARNARSSCRGIVDWCFHDYYRAPVKRVPLSASIPENHDEITYFRILGRITRCSSYHLCYLSGSGGRRRFEPHFQHCILYYHCLIGRTGNNHFFRRPDFESFQTAGKNR